MTSPAPHADATVPPQHLFNRELSWLEFNSRVLHEAFDPRNALLERVKFLGIFSTNLDEFYMVRVAGLRRQIAAGVTQPAPDGLTPQQQLDAICERVLDLIERQRYCLHELLLPALAAEGVRLVRMSDLAPDEWLVIDEFFESQVFPVLTPLAVDPGHPFPYISNLSLSLAVQVRDPESDQRHFARVKVPKSLPRWVAFGRPNHFVPLEDVIGANLGALFPGMEVSAWYAFRLTRYADLELANTDESDDLLEMIEKQVFERRFGEVVRVEVQEGMPAELRDVLLEEIQDAGSGQSARLDERDVQVTGPLLELGDLMALSQIEIPELRDAPFTPIVPAELRDLTRPLFDVIREHDVLVHHPFHSFAGTVERFLTEASADPNVLAIKMTLYRTSGDTAIVRALTEAAERGKQVAVLVELQARGDEVNNIAWARTLEDFGVHVAYGVPGLKTHAKTALVVRRDPDGIRRYVHIGTGNYNSKTARLYTDFGLFTCSASIGADVSDLFNLLTGFSRQRLYRELLVAPTNMRPRFLELVEREAQWASQGGVARIVIKINALVDPEMIAALYSASQRGVEVDLLVRGICCLRPGVAGLSDRIRVISIVGRFLEHSRVFYFENNGAPEFFLGSADLMPRNLDRRVEAITPVHDPALQANLNSLLRVCLRDNRQAWELSADGTYQQRTPDNGDICATHTVLLHDPWGLQDGRTGSPYREAVSVE